MHIATRAKRCETSRAIRRVATICTYVHMVATLIYLDLPFILVLHLDAYFSFLLITHATSPAWCRSGNHTFSRLQLPLRIQLLLSSPFLRFFEWFLRSTFTDSVCFLFLRWNMISSSHDALASLLSISPFFFLHLIFVLLNEIGIGTLEMIFDIKIWELKRYWLQNTFNIIIGILLHLLLNL